MTTKLLVSKKQAAEALSISVRAVEYLISQKALPTRRIGARVLIPAQAIEQFARHDHPHPLATEAQEGTQ